MKKNDPIGNQEFEKLLKDKMSGLSANVDCFDKISARAFPDKSEDFSDSELTVSGLENITGKRRPLPVLKWVSIAAALVLVIGVLPKTILMSSFKQRLMNQKDKNTYRELLSEIKSETESGSYTIMDMPLEEYIANDVLITPFYSCPFGSSDKPDMNVRLCIRTVNDIPTNQIYAIEYCGEYSESAIVAAAKSKADISDDEISELEAAEIPSPDIAKGLETVSDVFLYDENGLTDQQGEPAAAASFFGTTFYKDCSDIYTVNYNVLYYHNEFEENGSYYYDITADSFIDGEADSSYTVPENAWKCSVNYNNTDAFPESSGSSFKRVQLFSSTDTLLTSSDIFSIMPFVTSNSGDILSEDGRIQLYLPKNGNVTNPGKLLAELSVPADEALRRKTSVYFPASLNKNKDLDSIVIIAGGQSSKTKFIPFRYDSFITSENIFGNLTEEELRKKIEAMNQIIEDNSDELGEAKAEMMQQYISDYENELHKQLQAAEAQQNEIQHRTAGSN